MKVLITGGAGFIGSHLAEKYLANGYQIVIIDNLVHGIKRNIPRKVVFYQCDIREKNKLSSIIKREKPDAINHHAAIISDQQATPTELISINVDGTKSVLAAAENSSIKHIIFASSAAVYGDAKTLPISESAPLSPINDYGRSKLRGERLLTKWSQKTGIPVAIFRYANVYGPRQRGGVISQFVKRALTQKTLTMDNDGSQTRDFIFVDDVVTANLLATYSQIPGIFNISTETQTSIKKLTTIIAASFDEEIVIKNRILSFPIIQHSALDNAAARTTLSWQPQTTIRQGLQRMVEMTNHEANH